MVLLAALVAGYQLYLRQQGINSWKGGGFGMYADYHPVYTKLLIRSKSGKQPAGPFELSDLAVDLMAKVQIYPHDDYLEALKAEYGRISGIDDLSIQVWGPVYNPDLGTYHMKLVKFY